MRYVSEVKRFGRSLKPIISPLPAEDVSATKHRSNPPNAMVGAGHETNRKFSKFPPTYRSHHTALLVATTVDTTTAELAPTKGVPASAHSKAPTESPLRFEDENFCVLSPKVGDRMRCPKLWESLQIYRQTFEACIA